MEPLFLKKPNRKLTISLLSRKAARSVSSIFCELNFASSFTLTPLTEINNKELVKLLKEKRFGDMRKWVIQNLDKDPSSLFTGIYDILYKNLQPQSVPAAVLTIADYQYKSAFVADHEINMVACLTQIMAECKFK